MKERFPPQPDMGTPLPATQSSAEARDLLALRRSAGKAFLDDPGPTGAELDDILRIAARVPDHRRLEPWRFIVFEGTARKQAGDILAEIFTAQNPDVDEQKVEIERQRLLRAPTVIAVVSSPNPEHKTPVWEQELSAGAVCHNLLLAANASGWAGVWLSEWICYDQGVAAQLGLSADERFAGFIYLGTATRLPQERLRPDIASKITRWSPGAS
ncbi:MAG: nitroreductase [Pseudomonadota bacterium]